MRAYARAREGPHRDNAGVLAFLLGPLVAVLGLLAAFIALRTRWRVRHSLYESLRNERRRQVEQARRRAVVADDPPPPQPAEEAPDEEAPDAEVPDVEVPEETFLQKVAAQLALIGALIAILLGVLLLITAARPE